MAFDHARGTLAWPGGVDGRALRNLTVDEFERGVGVEDFRTRFAAAVRSGDSDRILVWAGAGVGSMDAIKPAEVCVCVCVGGGHGIISWH
jgi:nitronate monooxygenase